jgi:hypothetical protein
MSTTLKHKPWMVCGPLPHDAKYEKGLNQEATTFFTKEGFRAFRDPSVEQLHGIFLLPHWETSLGARMIVRRVIASSGDIKTLMRVHTGTQTHTFIIMPVDLKVIEQILDANEVADAS